MADIEFPVNYIQVQQRLITAILAGEEDTARKIVLSVLNSNVDQVRILTDVIIPAANTISELYSRGKLGKTERSFLQTVMIELVNITKFNVRAVEQKSNANALFVAGSEDRVLQAKSAAVAFKIQGWNAKYVGNVEEEIDPFFDIDFQRYVSRVWSAKRGLMVICIFSSGEGSLRFLSSASRSLKGRLKGELKIAISATPELQQAAEEGYDYSAKDLLSLVEWAERQYNIAK